MTSASISNGMADPKKYRKAAYRFISLTTPVYIALYIILLLIRSLDYDHFSDQTLLISMGHIFGCQVLLLLISRARRQIDKHYVRHMLWFMVYNNILLFCYWVITLSETRTFVYILAPMSTVALFTITNFSQAIIYNIILCFSLAAAAMISDSYHYQNAGHAGRDWIYISAYFVVSIWLSRTAAVHAQNRQQMWSSITAAEDSKRELEYTLKQLEQAHNELEKVSLTDALTQVHNRRYFDQTMENVWGATLISKSSLSVLMIDVDHFKSFNDNYGHQLGDLCLQFIAQSIAACLGRQGDEICRYGGEEFSVILPNTDGKSAISVAERIRTSIAETPFRHNQLSLSLHVSIGIATLSDERVVERPETLIHLADKALYQAKAQGRNQVIHASQLSE